MFQKALFAPSQLLALPVRHGQISFLLHEAVPKVLDELQALGAPKL